MSDHSNRWKLVSLRGASVFLGVVGLSMGYFWCYKLGPMRRIYDSEWCRQHSEVARWEEYQTCIDRSGWDHDGFANVGRCGDKHWVLWIMEHIQPGDDISTCSAGHKSHGLRYLTNQDAGDTAEAWLAWWRQNKSKSQEDWIRDGFQKVGVELQKPPTQPNIIALLRLAAPPKEEGDQTHDYLQYNAFRWLRDSDFDPKTFAVKDIPANSANEVLQGLLRFARLSGEFPKYRRLGTLNLGESPQDFGFLTELSTPRIKTLVNLAIFMPVGIGFLLFSASFRVFPTWRVVEFLKIVLLAISAAIVYGVVHDQVTARVCVEYFTRAHPLVFPTDSPSWLGLGWGVIATWWVGLILGVPAAWLAGAGKLPKLGAEDLVRPLAVLLGTIGVLALVAGVITYGLARAGLMVMPQLDYQIATEHQAAFLAVAAAHVVSYGGGFIGGVVLCLWIRRKRRLCHADSLRGKSHVGYAPA